MGSDIRACVCSWIRSTGRGSGSVSSFGSSATIGTGYPSGDRTKGEDRGVHGSRSIGASVEA